MKIFRCRECGKYFHKSMHHSKCIYCGSMDAEMLQDIESSNKEAVRHYKKGCQYLCINEYDLAREEFFLSTRFDLEYSEAYWMAYLAKVGVESDDELIYSGKLNSNSTELINAVKYANNITKEIYGEIIRVNDLWKMELIQLSNIKYKQSIRACTEKNNLKNIIERINKDYSEIKKCKHMLIESKHKLMNLKWSIQQKYANTEYIQLKFCNDVIEKFMRYGYVNMAKSTEGIISVSAVKKYQDLIDIKEVDEKCKLCNEYRDVLNEITFQRDLKNKIKEHHNMLKKHKDVLIDYVHEIEKIEQSDYERKCYEDMYKDIDKTKPLFVNYDIIKFDGNE